MTTFGKSCVWQTRIIEILEKSHAIRKIFKNCSSQDFLDSQFAQLCICLFTFLEFFEPTPQFSLYQVETVQKCLDKSVWTKVTDNEMIQNKESEAYFLYLGARMTSLAPLETEICYHRNFFLVQTFLTDYESLLTTKCCNGNFLQISSKFIPTKFSCT